MKLIKVILIASIALFAVSSAATAKDFSWTRDFNIQAKEDLSGFRAKMASRFGLTDFQAIALRNIFASPADAYIMLRFGEIKGVLKKLTKAEGKKAIKTYKSYKSKGWNALAKILGVDTKCEEYVALKHGQDLYENNTRDRVVYNNYASANVN
jgi:hypothetical protein